MENLQPKLRFPEFKDEWKYKYLKDIGHIVGGGTPSTTVDKYWNGDINWFTPTEINSKYVTSSKRKITELAVSKSSAKILPKGSILLTTRATIGECSICLEESTTNQGFQSIVVNSFNSNEFVYYLINTTKNELIKKSSGSTFLEISKKKIETIEQYFPSLPEQTKIADFLGAVDKQLELLTTKKEKLQLYKKGVMQKLFSQEIRFTKEDGTNYPDWEEKTLGEVATFFNGRAYKQSELLDNGKYPVLRVGNFFSNNSWYYSDLELDNNKYCSEGDLLYAWSASFGPKIWKGDKVIYHYHIWKVEEKVLMNKTFLYHFLNFNTEIIKNKSANGLAMMHITKGAIEAWNIFIPNLDEQIKIADFLTAIDNQIEAINNQITKTENYKKGLLQQMFV
ncbi:restriction endonuclease subunit S [Faecalibacter bovis]|uniref:Restriction endonuclease subunit S n=1 Tax=Faecalibacter bovis TaxID=2898187 RepID=A0ABX7XAD9_9FLAO|nr:restriction endonuclease subunit S [Faecalibacter bovis]QTV04861.1 restriction endonuclease subunit S [Faecalibacter bovis]